MLVLVTIQISIIFTSTAGYPRQSERTLRLLTAGKNLIHLTTRAFPCANNTDNFIVNKNVP